MRVLYLIDSLAPGGAEQSLGAIAPYLITRGIHLEVVALRDRPGVQPVLQAAGVDVLLVRAHTRSTQVSAIRRLVSERRPDLVHTTLFEADVVGRLASALARTPVVTTLASTPYGPEHRAQPGIRRGRLAAAHAADMATARLARRFHAVSETVATVMARRLLIRRSKIDVVFRGRDEKVLGTRSADRRTNARRSIGVADDTPVVLAAARQEVQKGLDLAIASWPLVTEDLPTAVLLIAGRPGNQTATLTELAQPLVAAGSVRFLGARDDVADLLCAADAFVLPSRWEGLPGAVLEAMALETPVVASDLPQVREAVSDSEALLVSAENPVALSNAIKSTLMDRGSAHDRAKAARERFRRDFAIERAADGMVAFYERALRR